MVGLDKIGNIFIYDSGNKKFRMLDKKDGLMYTLIDGACREDNTMPILDPPFDLKIQGAVCYKRLKTVTPMEDFNVYPEAIVEETDEDGSDVE